MEVHLCPPPHTHTHLHRHLLRITMAARLLQEQHTTHGASQSLLDPSGTHCKTSACD